MTAAAIAARRIRANRDNAALVIFTTAREYGISTTQLAAELRRRRPVQAAAKPVNAWWDR